MKNLAVQMYVKGKNLLRNERGAMSLEWLGIAALLIMIIGLVSAAIDGGTIQGVLDKIFNAIKSQIGGSGGGGGTP